MSQPLNILTFDIEDWFQTHKNRNQYSGNIWDRFPSTIIKGTEYILNFLEEIDRKATFFILGWVAAKYPALVKLIHSKGHEIAAHSNWHHNPHFLSPQDFEKDLILCLANLENACGEKVTTYRAPGFNLNLKDKWAFDILAANGITVDSSIELASPSTIPVVIETGTNQILEYPLVVSRYGFPFSGGGYFRLMPEKILKYFFANYKYNLMYFHPRDFDPDIPNSNMFSFFRNNLNKINTDTCGEKLKHILMNMETHTIKMAVAEYLLSKNTNE